MASPNVLTAHEQSFQQSVIERSREVPVLVDFWAPWCGPCRVLSPILEELAAAGEGAWLLVKVNTDENQALARKYHVQGIPFCVLFKGGEVVDSFVGAQSKAAVRRFLERWVEPKAGSTISEVESMIRSGSFAEARRALDDALAQTPDNERARLAYARLELAVDNPTAALEQLEYLPAEGSHAKEIGALAARARFMQDLPSPRPPLDELRAAVDAAPEDYEAHFRLGSAAALMDQRDLAAEQFLWILERNRGWNEGAARAALVDLFHLWGEDAPETARYRQRMSWVLFS